MGKKIVARFERKKDGIYFPDFDIHVAETNVEKAKLLVKIGHGIDVDEATKELTKNS
jgi:hypothetical protein